MVDLIHDAVEALARRTNPELWSSDNPDLSARCERRNSLLRARVRLGEVWYNPETEVYEDA